MREAIHTVDINIYERERGMVGEEKEDVQRVWKDIFEEVE